MNCITIVASSYEEAVKEAREQYGDRIRIHSRKDVVTSGFLGIGKKRHCELTCFLVDEPAAKKSAAPETQEAAPAQEKSVEQLRREAEEERDMRRFEKEAYTPDPESNTPDPALEPEEEIPPVEAAEEIPDQDEEPEEQQPEEHHRRVSHQLS